MKEPVSANLRLVNKGVRLRADAEGKPSIEIDSKPPYGAGDTLSALELFLVSLCGCAGGTILALLNKMRKTVDDFPYTPKGQGFKSRPPALKRLRST